MLPNKLQDKVPLWEHKDVRFSIVLCVPDNKRCTLESFKITSKIFPSLVSVWIVLCNVGYLCVWKHNTFSNGGAHPCIKLAAA